MTKRRTVKRRSLGGGLVLRAGVLRRRRQLPADVQWVLGVESCTSIRSSNVRHGRRVAKLLDGVIDAAIERARALGELDDLEAAEQRELLRDELDAVVDALSGEARDDDDVTAEEHDASLLSPSTASGPSPAEDPVEKARELLALGFSHEQVATMVGPASGAAEDSAAPEMPAVSLAEQVAAAVTEAVNGSKAVESKPLGEVVELHIAEKTTSVAGQDPSRKAGKATTEWAQFLREFAADLGADKLASEVTVDDVVAWMAAIKNANRATFAKTLMRWAEKRGWIEVNPFDRVTMPKRGGKAQANFTSEDLRKLFGPALLQQVTVRSPAKPWRYWAPLLQLCHGLRGGEALGLHVADFERKGDHLVMHITKANDPSGMRELKTATSERTLVVHPELRRLGFDAYLDSVPEDGWLFPEYVDTAAFRKVQEEGTDPRWTNAFATWFDKYRKQVGVDRRGLSGHKFRHAWRARATDAGIDQLVVERLGGWKAQDMVGRYGAGTEMSVDRIAELVASVEFPELEDLPAYSLDD